MIEILPVNQRLTYRLSTAEAKLYMFLLGDNWRFPTDNEVYSIFNAELNCETYVSTWCMEDIGYDCYHARYVIPVRDVDK
jgi:hypothetical protein